jgi:transcriptional regulator with XRE-family HTH domain
MAAAPIEIGPTGTRLAENLRQIRRAGLQQQQVSRRLENLGHPMSMATLSNIERLRRRVDVDDLVALSLALEVTPNRLLMPPNIDSSQKVPLTPRVSVPTAVAWSWARGDVAAMVLIVAGAPTVCRCAGKPPPGYSCLACGASDPT